MTFYVPETLRNRGKMLSVSGTTTLLANPTAHVSIADWVSPPEVGDTIVLIDSPNGLTVEDSVVVVTTDDGNADMECRKNSMLRCHFDLDWTTFLTQLRVVLTRIHADERAKSFSEGYLAGQALLAQSADTLLARGFSAARDALDAKPSSGAVAEPFAVLGDGRIHHQTGSNVTVDGRTLIAGLAIDFPLRNNSHLTTVAFFEHGKGEYDSANSFSRGKVKGQGNTTYQGAGVLAELALATDLALEGSLRGGLVETDYRTNDLGDGMKYDALKSSYVSAHLGVRKAWTLTGTTRLETTAQGIWTRQAGAKTRLHPAGEEIVFKPIESKRLRLAARLDHALNPGVDAYVGLAIDREFDGEAKATLDGFHIAAPKLKGTTGIAEIGLKTKPGRTRPFLIDVGVQAYTGRREGVTGSVRVHYFF
jgi:hypothetical protein